MQGIETQVDSCCIDFIFFMVDIDFIHAGYVSISARLRARLFSKTRLFEFGVCFLPRPNPEAFKSAKLIESSQG
jgi:hypothetical protein